MSRNPKLIHLVSKVRWCTVLLKGVKVKLSPQVCESDRFGHFVATMLKLQQSVTNKPDKICHRCEAAIQQVFQHWLRQTSLYLRHTMTSALRHD